MPKGDRSAIALDEEDEDEPAILSLPKPELQASWFPTLRTTLWVLACLYSFIDVSPTSGPHPSRKLIVDSHLSSMTSHKRQSSRVDSLCRPHRTSLPPKRRSATRTNAPQETGPLAALLHLITWSMADCSSCATCSSSRR